MLDPRPQGGRDQPVEPRARRLTPIFRSLMMLALFAVPATLAFWCMRVARDEPAARGPVRQVTAEEAAAWRTTALHRAALPDADISGTVRGEAGAALAGALVCASCAACELHEQPPPLCVQTDARGAFALLAPGARALLVSAAADGYLPGEANGGRPIVTGGTPRRGLEIALRRGGAKLAGTVSDALGGPIAHARVQAVRFEADARPLLETLSDAEGRFAFWTAPGRVTLRAEAEGYAPGSAHRVAPSDGVELMLAPAGTIRGRVVRAGSETPVAGVEVRAVPLGSLPRAAPAISDERGAFELAALDPGLYRISAEADRWRGASERQVELGLAELVKDVTVTVVPAVSVIGHLLDAEQRPCPGGSVTLGQPTLSSSARARAELSEADLEAGENAVPSVHASVEPDGTVRLKGLSPGRYHAVLRCDGNVLKEGPELLDVRDQNLEVTWKMERGIGLTIHVVDAAGRPVPRAGVTLISARDGRRAQDTATALEADARGIAQVSTTLYPGTYTIQPYGLRGEPVKLVLPEGAGQVDVTLRLEGSGSILVDARDAQDRPLDGLDVSARRER